MPGVTSTDYLDSLNYAATDTGAALSAETSDTLGTARTDYRVVADSYSVSGLQITRMRDLLVAITEDLKGGSRLRVRKQNTSPFGANELGYWADSGGLPRFNDGSTAWYVQRSSTDMGNTNAAMYSNGTSAADQTWSLAAANGGGFIIKDNASTVGNMFKLINSSSTVSYFGIHPSSSNYIRSAMADGASAIGLIVDTVSVYNTVGAKYLAVQGGGGTLFSIGSNGNVITGGSTPTVTANLGAGGGASATITGNDSHGFVTLTTGTTPSVGRYFTVTFASSYPSAPTVMVIEGSSTAAGSVMYVPAGAQTHAVSAGGWTLCMASNLGAAADHVYNYMVLG